MRTIDAVYDAPPAHWVGDGFKVRSLLTYSAQGAAISPFLLLDHAAEQAFPPAKTPRGVGAHPHRGFETVTIVYAGEVEHRDSAGHRGRIGVGDAQWMTAGSGVLHDEFHSQDFTRRGGALEMAQLWVNLPTRAKMTAPAYQTLRDADIPRVELADGAGVLRVLAGRFGAAQGPARTATPLDVWDVRLNAGGTATLAPPQGHNFLVALLKGAVRIGERRLSAGQTATFARGGGDVAVVAEADSALLALGGEPIDEPVVMRGPFVMNTAEEIRNAVADFSAGRFGALAS